MENTQIRVAGGRLRLEPSAAGQERARAQRLLLQYDPAGIAASVEGARSLDELRSAAAQLAYLVDVLASLAR